jgi:hypothetical protein
LDNFQQTVSEKTAHNLEVSQSTPQSTTKNDLLKKEALATIMALRSAQNITSLFFVWTVDTIERLSVRNMEKKSSVWRAASAVNKLYSRRKLIVDFIDQIAKKNVISDELAVAKLETFRQENNLSLNSMSERKHRQIIDTFIG